MSGVAWAVAALLLTVAAAVAAWPAGTVLRRLNGRRRIAWRAGDLRLVWPRVRAFAEESPRRAVGVAALTGGTAGLLAAGPVAGLVLALYGALGARAAVRRAGRRRVAAARSRSLDDLNALAADLRAGLAVGPLGGGADLRAGLAVGSLGGGGGGGGGGGLRSGLAVGPSGAEGLTAGDGLPDRRLAELTAAVWRLAEQTGAPAADLVERIEADARAADRSRATAMAQAAGAQATALLLAALPIGGIALGFGIGVNPLQVLLETGLGAVCAVAAVLLQCAGLVWADRLANGPVR